MYKVLCLLFILLTSCCLNPDPKGSAIKIMSWNVQNLFNGVDDGVEYNEFSIKEGEWSEEFYIKRLQLISKIILLNEPDIIGLQEIEGEVVLNDLREKYLIDYKYVAFTKDPGAIQLGFLSKYPIQNVCIINPNKEQTRLRSLLEVTFNINGESLIIINNHWKSKSGGFSENLRIESSIALKKRLNELNNKQVLALGDLNENYNEYQRVHKSYETALMLNESGYGLSLTGKKGATDALFSPWVDSEFKGSYFYKDCWETIDNFLLNHNLVDTKGLYFDYFKVDNRSLLLNPKGGVNKWIKEYNNGYSDHLPIILGLGIEQEVIQTTLE